jgi:hypothetical protein
MWSGAGNLGFGGLGDLEGSLSMGAGDPIAFSFLQEGVFVIGSEFLWDYFSASTREASPVAYSQQGGALIDLISTLGPWPRALGPYKVKLVSLLGQEFPNTYPNAHSAIEGRNDDLIPFYGNQVLRFAMPRCPLGIFSIKIFYGPYSMTLPNIIRAVPDASSPEVNRFRGVFNVEVYSKRGPMT